MIAVHVRHGTSAAAASEAPRQVLLSEATPLLFCGSRAQKRAAKSAGVGCAGPFPAWTVSACDGTPNNERASAATMASDTVLRAGGSLGTARVRNPARPEIDDPEMDMAELLIPSRRRRRGCPSRTS